MTFIFIVAFLAPLVISFGLTPYVRKRAVKRGIVAEPASHHIHRRPIPRLGGIAIYLSFVLVTVLLALTSAAFRLQLGLNNDKLVHILVPGTLIFLLGLYDDLRGARPAIKFGVQTLAAVMLFASGLGGFRAPELLGVSYNWPFALGLTILWVLWITNAFNLIDGLDGLAAGSSLFSILTVFVACLISGNLSVALLAVALAGATLGFLRYNFNPATIFLGDSGSLFLGFMLSALALAGSQKTPTMVAVAIPVVSFGLPLLDTALSVVRRFLSGQPLFTADREHIHHKLLARGLSHRQAVVVLYGASAFCGLLSLFLLYPRGGTIAVVLIVLGAGIWIGLQQLGYHELHELGRAAQRTIEQKQIIANNVAVRRAAERLKSVGDFLHLCWVLQDAFETNDFDGYQLSLSDEPVPSSASTDLWMMTREDIGGQRFAWHKPYEDVKRKGAPAWSVTLELTTTAGERRGYFMLYRLRSRRQLLVDLNLLTSEFQVTLADAVDRLLKHSKKQTASTKKIATGPLVIAGLKVEKQGLTV